MHGGAKHTEIEEELSEIETLIKLDNKEIKVTIQGWGDTSVGKVVAMQV